MQTREAAWALLTEWNQEESHRKHALAVEAVMRHFAPLYGADPDYWGQVGLLHDVDYERYPEEHCVKAEEILRDAGYDEAFIHAVASHGWGLVCNVEPELPMEKVLYTIDELTGLITAAAYMRPSKSVLDMDLKSLKKKFKAPSFAAGVNRDVIRQGCGMLGVELDEVLGETLEGMKEAADALGLGMQG